MTSEDFSFFINVLMRRLQGNLPGESAQYKMAPHYRPRFDPQVIESLHPKRGAVLLLLYFKEGEWFTVFTQRSNYSGVHSGQMSFPGGKADRHDENLVQTALREAEEEIGVSKQCVGVLGLLSELYIPPSNFLVQPVVGYACSPLAFTPHEREVAKIVEIPISFFADDNNIQEAEISLGNHLTTKVPAFIFKQHIIWGATAIVLSEFREIYKEVMATLNR
jgi:8-oxo-dGTP pyrophosphatase MutT (NUDIX family)